MKKKFKFKEYFRLTCILEPSTSNTLWDSRYFPTIIKQRCFLREWGRGEEDFFFGLAINRANILYRDLTGYISRHPKKEAFWRDSSPTTYKIILNCWQHHQTRLPMVKGTVSRDFRPSVFFVNRSPLGP
jgi:hypothetical protein